MEIPVWKTILSVAVAGFVILGQDVRKDVHTLQGQMGERREIDAGAMQFRTDVRERLERIETDIREIRREKLDHDPLPAGTDLTPVVRQLNRMETEIRKNREDVDRLYRHLSGQ